MTRKSFTTQLTVKTGLKFVESQTVIADSMYEYDVFSPTGIKLFVITIGKNPDGKNWSIGGCKYVFGGFELADALMKGETGRMKKNGQDKR